jgi:drug/metabolite transporter (DMT)-like permease
VAYRGKRDYKGVAVQFTKMIPVAALLTGATVWGLIWYPFRVLGHSGISGEEAVTITYGCALVLGAMLYRSELASGGWSWALVGIAFTAGWANVGFTMGVVYGDVMRVVLLFYLSPVWTVLFARVLLDERLSYSGYGLMAVAFAGALIVLWHPQSGWPYPRSVADWCGLSAGLAFALSNVLARRALHAPISLKVLAVFAGGVFFGALCTAITHSGRPLFAWISSPGLIGQLLLLSVVMLCVNVAVQFGLTRVTANRAIVIYLFELVVTALSTWLLLDEVLTLREWCGGAMIVVAGLYSDRLSAAPKASARCAGQPMHQD